MKKLFALIILTGILLPVSGWAQPLVRRNDGAALTFGQNDGGRASIAVDSNGRIFTSTGSSGGVHAEDAVHGSGDAGSMCLAVRNDTLAALAGTDGDYASLQVNDIGALFTTGEHTEDAAHASGDNGSLLLGVRNDSAATTFCGANGDYCPVAVAGNGKLFTVTGYAEDSAHSSTDFGNQVLAVREDVPVGRAADGDYHTFQVDADGNLWMAGSQDEDAVHASGDRGVQVLFKQTHTLGPSANDGDYSVPNIDGNGRIYTVPISNNICLDVALTVQAAAYAQNDVLGGKLTFSGASQSGATRTKLVSLVLADEDGAATNATIVWFDTDPTNSTFTENAALTIHDSDLDDVSCSVPLTSHTTFAANGVSMATNIGCAWRSSTVNSYAVVRVDAAVTPTVTDGFFIKACFERD